jgi:hypothetical protein
VDWKDLAHHLRHISEGDRERVKRAYDLGESAHRGQKRKSGEPYFTHPVAVAGMLADMGADTDTVIAALLHDTVEDTPLTLDEIDRRVDGAARDLIDGVTKLEASDVEGKPTLNERIETLRKMFTLMQHDVRIMVIKLVDRLHNMQTIQYLSPTKQRTLAEETRDVYVKIADRLCIKERITEWLELVECKLGQCLADEQDRLDLGERNRADNARKVFGMRPDDVVAESMKGIDSYLVGGWPDELEEPRLHGVDPGFGERKREYRVGWRVGARKYIGYAQGQDLGLPGAWASHHHYRSFYRVYGLFLGRIEPFIVLIEPD